jgi:hypothetical protein
MGWHTLAVSALRGVAAGSLRLRVPLQQCTIRAAFSARYRDDSYRTHSGLLVAGKYRQSIGRYIVGRWFLTVVYRLHHGIMIPPDGPGLSGTWA